MKLSNHNKKQRKQSKRIKKKGHFSSRKRDNRIRVSKNPPTTIDRGGYEFLESADVIEFINSLNDEVKP